MKTKLILTALVAVALAPAVRAQDEAAPTPPAPPQGDHQAGPHRPLIVPPLFAVLDLDKDGTLSAEEIAKAAESLKKLDKNGDGAIDRNELPPPPRLPGIQNKPGGPRQGPPQAGRGRQGPGPVGGVPGPGAPPPPPPGAPQGGPPPVPPAPSE